MAVQRNFETLTLVASQDLTAHQFMPVMIAGGVAITSLLAKGLLQNKALAGDYITVGYKGQMKAKSGAAINSGSQLGVTTSGFLISVVTSAYVGFAMEQVGSGDLFTGIFDFVGGQIA